MSKSLIIVESPSKAKTLKKYLGRNFNVLASVGHIKDLPKSKFGVDLDKNFEPRYIIIRGKKKILDEIKKAAKAADKVYLGPDPDREGEAIAWHIAEELDGKQDKIYRVLFHEITEGAIKKALAQPGKIDQKKVNAQQARRILDRIVGYKLSPLLWEKVRMGLSAGRVQSVAVRLICEREKEIEAFVSEEYWSITAQLSGAVPPPFEARLHSVAGQPVKISMEAQAHQRVEALEGLTYVVQQIERREKKRNPAPPFTTSQLQQEAARKLRFSPKKTMMLAQQLYEGVEIGKEGPVGLITYLRTDSTRLSPEAQQEAREFIQSQYGQDYLPAHPNIYKNRKGSQDAHEAIRPTSVHRDPEALKPFLHRDHYHLYKLIWNRFLASQMNPAILEVTRVDIAAREYLFRATGTVTKFPGFTTVYVEGQDNGTTNPPKADGSGSPVKGQETEDGGAPMQQEGILPALQEGERLALITLKPKQHFTQPPPRYNEALLIKELEERAIGRPSTYHTITSTIQDRKYVEKVEGRFKPTELGGIVNELLVTHFPDVLNVEFTARMEEELDEIEEGDKRWVDTVRDFYEPFHKRLEKAQHEMRDIKREEIPTEIACDRCGLPMVIRWGRNGRFLACTGYPGCRNTKEFMEDESGDISVVQKETTTSDLCERCGSPMVIKNGRFGRFVACSRYPDCKFTKAVSTGVKCPRPDCGGDLTEKRTKKGKVFFACSRYPQCDFALWDRPLPRPCPECKVPYLVERYDRRSKQTRVQCPEKDCGYKESP
ncbi:MAG: type I DNA topoisomerase [Nitrospiria bacterium]